MLSKLEKWKGVNRAHGAGEAVDPGTFLALSLSRLLWQNWLIGMKR